MAIRVSSLTAHYPIQVPGVINIILKPGQHKVFPYVSFRSAMEDSRISEMVAKGQIRLEDLDTLTTYTDSTLPAANAVPSGTVVWSDTERTFLRSDGSNWVSPTEGGSVNSIAGEDIPANVFVGWDDSAELMVSPTTGERWAGIATEDIDLGDVGKVQTGGKALVLVSTDIDKDDELVAMPGGYATKRYQQILQLDNSGARIRGADARDDIDQTALPAQVEVAVGGDETGNSVVIYGDVAGGTYTVEILPLGAAGPYTSTATFGVIYGLETTQTSANTIDIDGAMGALLIPQIAGSTPPRFYGAITPIPTDAQNRIIRLVDVTNTNVGEVVLLGKDALGAPQEEVITMTGNVPVDSTLEYAELDNILIGADGIVFGAAGEYYSIEAVAAPLMAAQTATDASDDIDQTLLPSIVNVDCGGDETGNTVVVYGDVAGTETIETITLGPAASGPFASTNTFDAIYGLEVTAASVGTIDITDDTVPTNLIPQIAGATAARFYGAIVPTNTDSLGRPVLLNAEAANTGDVLLYGTDYAGDVQMEVVTMNGTTPVGSTMAFRSVDLLLVGADGIVFGGAGEDYTAELASDSTVEVRAYALEDQHTAGEPVVCMILPQNLAVQTGKIPVPFFSGNVFTVGGGAVVDVPVLGVSVGDVVQATLRTRTAAETLVMAQCLADDAVTLTFSGAPGASTVAITVWKVA